MQSEELQGLMRVLLYGGPESRRVAAERLAGLADPEHWSVLANTVRSAEPWQLRARCLEVLGLVAASADRETAEAILQLLDGGAWA